MLIVYQSLESFGEKIDSAYSTLTGNIFKQATHKNINAFVPNNTLDYTTPTWEETTKTIVHNVKKIKFAKSEESSALTEKFRAEKNPATRLAHIKSFMEKIINNIVWSTAKRTERGNAPSTRAPHLIVLGEVCGDDLTNMQIGQYKVRGTMNPTGDARHRFTVLTRIHDNNDADIELFSYNESDPANKDENAKCVMMKLCGWTTAFVHIPNSISNNPQRSVAYIKNNVKRALGTADGMGLDLLIGDTNQKSNTTVQRYMQEHYNGQKWHTSIVKHTQDVVAMDGHTVLSIKGTNSSFNKHIDMACSPHAIMQVQNMSIVPPTHENEWEENPPVFLFHGLTDKFIISDHDNQLYAYTDHNGVIVEILRENPVHGIQKQHIIRQQRKDDFNKKRIQKDSV